MINTEKIVTDEARALKDAPGNDGIYTTGGGIRVRIHPISTSLITELQSRIPTPDIPVWHNEEIGRDVSNPDDPAYKQALREVEMKRGAVAMNAAIMFGVELLDGMPEDKGWIVKLKSLGIEVNEKDDTELEFAYKKFIVGDMTIIAKVLGASGVTEAQLQTARDSFHGNAQ